MEAGLVENYGDDLIIYCTISWASGWRNLSSPLVLPAKKENSLGQQLPPLNMGVLTFNAWPCLYVSSSLWLHLGVCASRIAISQLLLFVQKPRVCFGEQAGRK